MYKKTIPQQGGAVGYFPPLETYKATSGTLKAIFFFCLPSLYHFFPSLFSLLLPHFLCFSFWQSHSCPLKLVSPLSPTLSFWFPFLPTYLLRSRWFFPFLFFFHFYSSFFLPSLLVSSSYFLLHPPNNDSFLNLLVFQKQNCSNLRSSPFRSDVLKSHVHVGWLRDKNTRLTSLFTPHHSWGMNSLLRLNY